MKRKNKKLFTILAVLGMAVGISLLLFPVISNAVRKAENSRAISSMTSVYENYAENPEIIEEQLEQARAYNRRLAGDSAGTEVWEYEDQLSFDGNGIMAYVEIPEIDLKMVIYHGTSEDVLAVGAGHLEGTSLPVGGESTHAVITAHSGLKTMKAFDDLRKLEPGSTFTITTLGVTLEYEVESVETVLPEETESLGIVKGEDRVTLVTCTPYGINDHRLLVHGKRKTD